MRTSVPDRTYLVNTRKKKEMTPFVNGFPGFERTFATLKGEMNQKFEQVDRRFDRMDQRFDQVIALIVQRGNGSAQ